MKLERDIVIEFAGMPKSGKTTVLDIVAHYLRRQSLPVAEFHGGGKYAPIGKQDLPGLNIYLACESLRYVLAADQLYREPRIHLMDRGVVDRIIFTIALNSIGRLSDEQRGSMLSMLALPEVITKIDKALVFITDPKKSLARETINKLSDRDGRIMNTSLLTALRNAVESWGNSDIRKPPTATIDTAALDERVQITALTALKEIDTVLHTEGIEIDIPAILTGETI